MLPAGVWLSAFSIRFEKSCARSWRSPVMATPSSIAAVERVPGVLGRRRVGVGDAAQQRGEVDVGEGALLRAGLDLGDAQQGGEDVEQPVGLGDRGLGRGLVFARGRRALAGILEPLAQAAERRAQVVRDVAGDLAQAVHELLDAARAWR